MDQDEEEQKKIPLFGTWNKWYVFLLVVLFIQVVLYTWLTYTYL